MNTVNFKEKFLSSIHSRKMVNIEYSAEFLLPNVYRYHDIQETDLRTSDFLHLLGGGNLNADFPFAFHFSPVECGLLLYTDSGVGRITTSGGTEYSVADNQLLFLNCNQTFTLQSIVLPWNFKLFFIDGDSLPVFLNIVHSQKSNCFHLTPVSPILHDLRSLLSVRQEADISDLLFMHRNLTEILSLLCSSCYPAAKSVSSNAAWYLIEMKDFLDNHYQQDFSLRQFEETFKINRYRLCREFSACYGLPPLQYLTRKRLDEAKKILLTTDFSIHEVSSIIGYENTKHFINLFKKYESMTPGKFRQTVQQEQSVSRCPSPQTFQAT